MNEAILTNFLIKSLKRGELGKIVESNGRRVTMKKEIGDGSFRADIFISLENTKGGICTKFNFVAIEVKIKDWKQGLYQAYRYKSFAEKSYLAIYEKHADGVDLNLFKKYNVGLIIFNKNKITVLNNPKNNIFTKKSYSFELRNSLLSKLSLTKCI